MPCVALFKEEITKGDKTHCYARCCEKKVFNGNKLFSLNFLRSRKVLNKVHLAVQQCGSPTQDFEPFNVKVNHGYNRKGYHNDMRVSFRCNSNLGKVVNFS